MGAIPDDPQQFFDVWLPASFAADAASLAGKSSPGAVVFRVGERAPIAVRLTAGVIATEAGVPADTIVQVSLVEHDFAPVIVRGAELIASASESEQKLFVLRALTIDGERADLIRGVPGSVAFVLAADPAEHRIVLTPGVATPSLDAAECTVRCVLADFLALQRGETNPFELMMNGKIQISGDAQIPLALSSLLT